MCVGSTLFNHSLYCSEKCCSQHNPFTMASALACGVTPPGIMAFCWISTLTLQKPPMWPLQAPKTYWRRWLLHNEPSPTLYCVVPKKTMSVSWQSSTDLIIKWTLFCEGCCLAKPNPFLSYFRMHFLSAQREKDEDNLCSVYNSYCWDGQSLQQPEIDIFFWWLLFNCWSSHAQEWLW